MGLYILSFIFGCLFTFTILYIVGMTLDNKSFKNHKIELTKKQQEYLKNRKAKAKKTK